MSVETVLEPASPKSRPDRTSTRRSKTTPRPTGRIAPWAWSMRNVAVVVLEAAFGGLLLAFGEQAAAQAGPLAPLLAIVLVVVNAVALTLITGVGKRGGAQRLMVLAGLVVGGVMACTGVALTAYGAAWQTLTLFGVLLNIELANTAAMLPASQDVTVAESLRDS